MRKRSIGERPGSRRDLAGWYASALEAQRASGLSVAEYATRIGVSAPTLYQWRRRLEAAGGDEEAETRLIEVTGAPYCPRSQPKPNPVFGRCHGAQCPEVELRMLTEEQEIS